MNLGSLKSMFCSTKDYETVIREKVTMVERSVKEFRDECMSVISKLESLLEIGISNGEIKPYDISALKERVLSIRTDNDIKRFMEGWDFIRLQNLIRLCGKVCCKHVVEPNTIMQIFTCNGCPIFSFEKKYL